MKLADLLCRRWQKCLWVLWLTLLVFTFISLNSNHSDTHLSSMASEIEREDQTSGPSKPQQHDSPPTGSLVLNALKKHPPVDHVSVRQSQRELVILHLDLPDFERNKLRNGSYFNVTRHKPDGDSIQSNQTKGKSDASLLSRIPSCRKLDFSDTAQPLVALASWPGSGNTWMRHLIQQVTGIYTGSIYYDKTLKKHGYLGEGIYGRTVLGIKTHEWPGYEPKMNIQFTRAVLLLRHPKSALKSEFKRRVAGHIGTPRKSFNTIRDWRHFAAEMIEPWVQFQLHWLHDFDGPLHVIWYEELKLKPRETLQSLLLFIRGREDVNESLNCTLGNNVEGLFHRNTTNDSFLIYSTKHLKDVEAAYNIVYTAVEARCPFLPNCGYPPYTTTTFIYLHLPLILSCCLILYIMIACVTIVTVPDSTKKPCR